MGQATEEYQRIASGNLPSSDGQAIVRAIRLTQSKCRRFIRSLISKEQIANRGASVQRGFTCQIEIHQLDKPPIKRTLPFEAASQCLWLLSVLNRSDYSVVEETFAPDIERALVDSTHTTLLELGQTGDITVQIDVSASWIRERSIPVIQRATILLVLDGRAGSRS